MHTGLLCVAVRDLLRDWFKDNPRCPLSSDVIHVTPDEKPFPYSGDTFIAVYGSTWSPVNDDVNVALDYMLGVTCTLTVRTAYVPNNKLGLEVYAKQYLGMSATCVEIMRAVSQNTTLFSKLAANKEYQYYSTPDDNGFVIGQLFEYLRYQGTDATPNPVYAEHFTAKNEHLMDDAGLAIMGYTMSVRFGKARCGIRQ